MEAPRWEREPPMTPVLLDLVAAYRRRNHAQAWLRPAGRTRPPASWLLDTLRESHWRPDRAGTARNRRLDDSSRPENPAIMNNKTITGEVS